MSGAKHKRRKAAAKRHLRLKQAIRWQIRAALLRFERLPRLTGLGWRNQMLRHDPLCIHPVNGLCWFEAHPFRSECPLIALTSAESSSSVDFFTANFTSSCVSMDSRQSFSSTRSGSFAKRRKKTGFSLVSFGGRHQRRPARITRFSRIILNPVPVACNGG